MKFRYYITDLFSGTIAGTSDDTTANEFSCADEFFVVDTETGEHIVDGDRIEVEDIADNS